MKIEIEAECYKKVNNEPWAYRKRYIIEDINEEATKKQAKKLFSLEYKLNKNDEIIFSDLNIL